MKELVLNEACLETPLSSPQEATEYLISVSRGIAALVRDGVANNSIRASTSIFSFAICPGFTLWHAIELMLRSPNGKDNAAFLLRLTQRAPVQDGIPDGLAEQFWLSEMQAPAPHGSENIVLCALAKWIAVALPTEARWDTDLLDATIVSIDSNGDEIESVFQIDHLSREQHAQPITLRFRASSIAILKPPDFWGQKGILFPNLRFGLQVEGQITLLGLVEFQSALSRLQELDLAAAQWRALGGIRPRYFSKITGESQVTMQQYGAAREFQDSNGIRRVYELHARLANGNRIHFLEDAANRALEIGYIGKHLPTSIFN